MKEGSRQAMTTAAGMGEKSASSTELAERKSKERIEVPIQDAEGVEGIALGFRMNMFEIADGDGKVVGNVSSGSGLGTDFIILDWTDDDGEHQAYVRGLDLLIAHVRRFNTKAAEGLEGIRSGG